MCTIYGAKHSFRAILSVYAITVAVLFFGFAPPNSMTTWPKLAVLSVNFFMVLVGVFAGFVAYNSLWRIAFRRWPQLNRWVYPDLNGVWYGRAFSNWALVDRQRGAAEAEGGLELKSLARQKLQEVEIAIEIEAALFEVTITAATMVSGESQNRSRSTMARVSRGKKRRNYTLYYMFEQETPEPAATDEGLHLGAAALNIELGVPSYKMSGEYWTRRKWREGMNTAGTIELRRVSDRHVPAGADLLEHARSLASATTP